MNYPALIFWVLIVWSATTGARTVLVLFLASIPFASLALLPPGVVGGMSLLPLLMFSVVLIAKVVAPQAIRFSPKFVSVLKLRHLGFLVIFVIVGVVAAIIMPRLFSGDIVIIPMREMIGAELLVPNVSNFTQSGYVLLSVLTAIAVALMSDEPNFVKSLLVGVLTGGVVCIVTGLMDVAAASTGTEELLAPFRNAGYAYLTNAGIGGFRRVVGLTPEASAYGPICVQFAAVIAFLRPLYRTGRPRNLATLTAGGLTILALLSTSSTAYAGLTVLALVYAVNLCRRATVGSALGGSGLLGELSAGFALVIALLAIAVVRSDLFDPLIEVVNEVVFNKAQSSSYYERSFWTTTAWNSVGSTWGLGVGLGSTRTSNWFAAVVSNTGLLGAAAMAIFLVQTFTRRSASRAVEVSELMFGLKLSIIPAFAMAGLDSPGPDFGPWVATAFGAIAGLSFLRVNVGYDSLPVAKVSIRSNTNNRKSFRPRAVNRTMSARRWRSVPDSSST